MKCKLLTIFVNSKFVLCIFVFRPHRDEIKFNWTELRPTHQLNYRLWRHNYVIVVMSQIFCYHCVEYIKLDTCAKVHDHRSNNNKVMMGGGGPSCPTWLTVQKKPMSNKVNVHISPATSHWQNSRNWKTSNHMHASVLAWPQGLFHKIICSLLLVKHTSWNVLEQVIKYSKTTMTSQLSVWPRATTTPDVYFIKWPSTSSTYFQITMTNFPDLFQWPMVTPCPDWKFSNSSPPLCPMIWGEGGFFQHEGGRGACWKFSWQILKDTCNFFVNHILTPDTTI